MLMGRHLFTPLLNKGKVGAPRVHATPWFCLTLSQLSEVISFPKVFGPRIHARPWFCLTLI